LDKGTPEGLSGTHNDLQLSALFNFISEHYHEDLSLLRLARAANASVNYLNEFMQRTIGQGPIEYLTRYRIEQARRILENSGDTISQIAMDTGFYDASHFIRVFKQCTGITPGEYRKMLKR
jgi:AraC-like DNA-binding protein